MLTDVRSTAPHPPGRRISVLADHRVFAVVLSLAAALRVVTMLAYRPAKLYWYDSFTYLDNAIQLKPSTGLHPIGYSLLLRALWPFHSVELLAAVNHLLGLTTAVLIYAVLRRRSLPGWAASLATVPGLFDASFLRLEHAVLSDTLFIFLITAALTVLMWSPWPSARAATLAGLLLALAAITRTIALPVLLLILLVLACRGAVRRGERRAAGLRPLLALALAGTLPLAAYAGWYAEEHGRFTLTQVDGISLWARTMTFADCSVIEPPPELAPLCPNGVVEDTAGEYYWVFGERADRLPGGAFERNDAARAFALRAILAQPFDYLRDVVHDTALTFAWTPVPHPTWAVPAFGFGLDADAFPDEPLIGKMKREYDSGIRPQQAVRPYADFLVAYQHPAYLRGPMLGAILLVGALGSVGVTRVARRRRRAGDRWERRAALLPWSVAAALLVAPVAVLDFDHRYVLPVIPIACLAAALAVQDETRALRGLR